LILKNVSSLNLEEFKKTEENLISSISRFIKKNPSLVHLSLENCGLTENVVTEISHAIRKSKAICCIHLSANPGINKQMKAFIFDRIHCRQISSVKKPDFEN
jgi:hypothetical protein